MKINVGQRLICTKDLYWHNDTDLCFKAKAMGKTIYYSPKALVYHIEHGSGEIKQEFFQNNVNNFLQKWKNKLSSVNVL